MLYIEIPEDMEYKAVPVVDNSGNTILDDDGKPTHEDFFVSKNGARPNISIQKAIHIFQHTFHQKNKLKGEVNGLVIHKKRPACQPNILEYRPNRSGLLPTDHAHTLHVQKYTQSSPPSATRWINHTFLREKTAQKAKEKELAQKENRRKTGDSPNAN